MESKLSVLAVVRAGTLSGLYDHLSRRKVTDERPAGTSYGRVFLVEDHPVLRQGLRTLISMEPDLVVCGEAESVSGAMEGLETAGADVVLIDLALKQSNGMDLVRLVHRHWIGMRTIVISAFDSAIYGSQSIRAGALAYVSKHEATDVIVDTIRKVLYGKAPVQMSAEPSVTRWFM